MPTVSVIIPTYNRANRLPRAINSVLDQTFTDFEVIVIDDASSDETSQVVRDCTDNRLQYIQFEENQGANAARNTGIQAATGEFISFLDSDDELLPSYLERTTDTLRRAPADCAGVFTSREFVTDGEVVRVRTAPDRSISSEEVFTGNVVGGFSSTTFRAGVFDSVGELDERLVACQDIDFYVRVLEHFSMRGINEMLVRRHVSGERLSSNMDTRLRGHSQFLDKHENRLSPAGRAHANYYRAFAYMRSGDTRRARQQFRRAIHADPKNWLYYYHYLASLFGRRAFFSAVALKKRLNIVRHRLA